MLSEWNESLRLDPVGEDAQLYWTHQHFHWEAPKFSDLSECLSNSEEIPQEPHSEGGDKPLESFIFVRYIKNTYSERKAFLKKQTEKEKQKPTFIVPRDGIWLPVKEIKA